MKSNFWQKYFNKYIDTVMYEGGTCYERKNQKLKEIIDGTDNLVFFGGAGVSTESGIPDFRSTDGLYSQKYDFPPETIVSHTFFMKRNKDFFDFYKDKMMALDAKPNAAHYKLAEWEAQGKCRAVVTQNIDGLHQMAGSKNVLELHGSIHRNYCMRCGKFFDAAYVKNSEGAPKCDECGGLIKPDVVLYEEGLDESNSSRIFSPSRIISSSSPPSSIHQYPESMSFPRPFTILVRQMFLLLEELL